MSTVSVVVPLYNKKPYIQRCLDSILGQSFGDFEVIVVDDGSTDAGAEIVESCSDPRIQLVRQENAGPGAARNRGIEEASAPYIAFLDADDEWLPDFLERTITGLERHPQAAAVTCAYFTDPGRKSSVQLWSKRGLADGTCRVNAATPPVTLLHRLAFMSPCTTVTRAPVLRRWGEFYAANKCRYAEDAFLWLKVLLNETVLFDLSPSVLVHTEASGLTKNLGGPHPIEPFLEHPEEIRESCPAHLRQLLDQFLAIRAFKTACLWGAWGRGATARQLRRDFRTPGDHRLPYYWTALLCSTPFGAITGAVLRGMGKQGGGSERLR